ncbi:AsmA family protein [Rhizobacter sp. AJA081-3]|uniref:AsmA family protein n=1 Tax=Rhizobacter sp. AJA081-3 TaxID=2753607 RepID=UPI001ADF190C|nr:AsmA family protein [Rhizobacter sp. AJA081-3]QTN21143.1 AsmA family protein [Rhizobacter sp. AJA081-3]
MPRLPRFALIGLGAVLGLLLLLAAALVLLADTDVYKSRLERIASQALGLELSIAGRPAIDIFPGLQLTLDDVHVRRGGKELASARQAKIGIDLSSLFGDTLRIQKIVLTQPLITVAREHDGRFDFEPQAPAAEDAAADAPVQDWPDVSLSAGSIDFVDKRHGKGFEARDCKGEVHRLQRAGGRRADFLREVTFTAEFDCAQIRKDGHTLHDVKFSADAKHGIVELKPLSTRLLGTPGQGSIRADFTGAVASYQIAYTLTQFPVEEFFSTMQLKKLAGGRMDFSATLTTHGTTLAELKQAMAGRVSLRGKGLTFYGSDLDRSFERFEASQTFSLVDVGAVFFAGPVGLLVTKGYDFAQLAQGNGGTSEIRTLVSDWKVERGVAHAQDVAMATKANRIALHGGLDFVNERFDAVTVALVDLKGCAIVKQEIRGSFSAPSVSKPNAIEALTGPALRLLKKGADALTGRQCEPFYSGAVAAPG